MYDKQLSLVCLFVRHLVHHKSSWDSFPLFMSWSYTIRLANCNWICIIHAPPSLIDEDSSFIAISSASIYDTILCCIKWARMCGRSAAINHSLCCTSDIWKLTLSIKFLNHWSKSHTDSVDNYLISLISVMHCDSDLGFLNSQIIASQISSRLFSGVPTGTTQNFINQLSIWPLRVVIICALFQSMFWTKWTIQTA